METPCQMVQLERIDYAFHIFLREIKKKKYLEKKYLLALPYGSELEVPKLHNLNHSWMVIKILFRSTPAPILT